jgi:hypothetical protein
MMLFIFMFGQISANQRYREGFAPALKSLCIIPGWLNADIELLLD